jgi:predicted secreted protein
MTEERRQFWLRHFARQLIAEQGQNHVRSRFNQLVRINADEHKRKKFDRLMGENWLVEISRKAAEMRRARV